MQQYFKSSLLDGAENIPEGHYEEENMKSTVVPFRNGIMLAIAAGIAESHNLNRIYIANHGGDHTIYPDCRPEFINAMTAATQAGTFNNTRVEAAFTNITKADIVRIGNKLWYKTMQKHGAATKEANAIVVNVALALSVKRLSKKQD